MKNAERAPAEQAGHSAFFILSFLIQKYSGSLPGFHLMLQPMLAFWFGDTGFPSSTASKRCSQVFAGDGDAVAWPAVVELAAIDKALVFVEQVEVRRASRPVGLGHGLRLVIKVREAVAGRGGLLGHLRRAVGGVIGHVV